MLVTHALVSDRHLQARVDDSTFELSKHKGKTIVLHFLLKTECPYCMRYTHDIAALVETNGSTTNEVRSTRKPM